MLELDGRELDMLELDGRELDTFELEGCELVFELGDELSVEVC